MPKLHTVNGGLDFGRDSTPPVRQHSFPELERIFGNLTIEAKNIDRVDLPKLETIEGVLGVVSNEGGAFRQLELPALRQIIERDGLPGNIEILSSSLVSIELPSLETLVDEDGLCSGIRSCHHVHIKGNNALETVRFGRSNFEKVTVEVDGNLSLHTFEMTGNAFSLGFRNNAALTVLELPTLSLIHI